MFASILKRVVSVIVLIALGMVSGGPLRSVHAQADNQSSEIVNLIANFHLYGEVQRFGLGHGDLELHFGVNSPAASLGEIEFIPGGTFQGSGVFSDLHLPAYGFTVIDKTFSVPFALEIDQPASLYMGIGENGSGFINSSNIQVIFDFSDNMYFGGSILRFTPNQGFKLTSVTLADGSSLADSNLDLTFEPAKTKLTAAVSAYDAQGSGLVAKSVFANDPEKRAFVMLNKATASARLADDSDGGTPTTALVDLDLVQEPDPYAFDFGYATVGGTGNLLLKRINSTPPTRADTTGVFRPDNGLLYLKNQNETGFADAALNYGLSGDYPVVGDWDGNGTVTIAVYRNGYFYLRNENTIGFAENVFPFGNPGDQPIAGDWDGDGIDTIGIYRQGTFLLRNSNSEGAAEMDFQLGNPGDVGIAGDWNGDGLDTTGVFRPANGILYLKNKNETGFADVALNYGLSGDQPVTGDWNKDGIDTIGVYRAGQFYLRNENTIGLAEIVFGLGIPGDMPIAGDWDGLP